MTHSLYIKSKLLVSFFLIVFFASCEKSYKIDYAGKPNDLYSLNETLSEALILGTFSPPAAARTFAYCNIAAYEALVLNSDSMQSLSKQFNLSYNLPSANEDYIPTLAMTIAYSSVAKDIVWHDYLFDDLQDSILKHYKHIASKKLIENSIQIGNDIASNIKNSLFKDGYYKTRKSSFYNFIQKPWAWETTPPKYAEAIEPWWHIVTPLVMDSANMFRAPKHPKFDTIPESDFYKEALESKKYSGKMMGDNIDMANFWDCNPYVTENRGHVTYTVRQMSPPAHWVAISIIAAKKKNLSLVEASEIITKVSVVLNDAFISCWETKYYYNLIRPITYINRYIDNDWKPLLETPPFPEYTSGHSVISRASAIVLEDYFGSNFEYTDDSEVPFGKKPRKFNDFMQASNEAAISRLFGGIHFRSGIENGILQGDNVGKYILFKLNTRKHP